MSAPEITEADREAAKGIAGPHFYMDEDCWYSCGLATHEEGGEPGSGCCNDENRGHCTCGLAERIEALALFRAQARKEGEREERERVVQYCDRPGGIGAWTARQALAREIEAGEHVRVGLDD